MWMHDQRNKDQRPYTLEHSFCCHDAKLLTPLEIRLVCYRAIGRLSGISEPERTEIERTILTN
jgi:hypothetical protein